MKKLKQLWGKMDWGRRLVTVAFPMCILNEIRTAAHTIGVSSAVKANTPIMLLCVLIMLPVLIHTSE